MWMRSVKKSPYRNKRNWHILVLDPGKATLEFLGPDRDIEDEDETIFFLLDRWTSKILQKPEKYVFNFEPLHQVK